MNPVVWAPEVTHTKPLPVLVWVHGGWLVLGDTNLPPYSECGTAYFAVGTMVPCDDLPGNRTVGTIPYFQIEPRSSRPRGIRYVHSLVDLLYPAGDCGEIGFDSNWSSCHFIVELNQPRHLIAFEWVLREISKFGGDPKKVTAFDESSGGSAINYHLAAQGGNQSLFSAAIFESGVADVLQPPAGMQGDFDSISNLTGCISPVKGGLPPRP
ncbi:hypothetical protein BC938DRAFT_472434 [Jimgerdemannia flammicorona]|uniref:Carboxylesterase type B domain-containing protein n=1 Tax=Jimgerdemannia flammicorona TaxID=994334 RepID=A0A433Q638_9FUNG|nr:hypothetical protein BC938DRAFT_472434 [Jimgerdemannia flammicorona]